MTAMLSFAERHHQVLVELVRRRDRAALAQRAKAVRLLNSLWICGACQQKLASCTCPKAPPYEVRRMAKY